MSAEITVRARWDRWDETVKLTLDAEQFDTLNNVLHAVMIRKGNPHDRWLATIIGLYVIPFGIKVLRIIFWEQVAEHFVDEMSADARRLRDDIFGKEGE